MLRDAAQPNFHHFADRCPNSRISPWLLFDMAHNRSWPGFCVQRVKRVPSLFFTLANITPERAEKLESPVNSRKCCRCWRSWSWDLWRFLLVQTVLLFRGEQYTRWGSLRIVGLRSDTGSQSSAAKIAFLHSTEGSAEPASELYTIQKVYTSFRYFAFIPLPLEEGTSVDSRFLIAPTVLSAWIGFPSSWITRGLEDAYFRWFVRGARQHFKTWYIHFFIFCIHILF